MRAQVAERVALRAVRHEVGPGRRLAVDEHVVRADALFLPQVQEHAPELVVAHARDVGGARAAAGGGDDHVGAVAAESLQKGFFLNLVEFEQRLADGDDHARKRLACAITAARSPEARAFWSTMLLPIPTILAPASK